MSKLSSTQYLGTVFSLGIMFGVIIIVLHFTASDVKGEKQKRQNINQAILNECVSIVKNKDRCLTWLDNYNRY